MSGNKKLLINCDDMGYHPAINQAIAEVLANGIVKSVSLMAAGPYFDDAVALLNRLNLDRVGVHLVLAAEYENLPMKPVSGPQAVPTLVTGTGHFFRSIEEVRDRASLEEVESEVRQQVLRVSNAGFSISHVDGHMFWYERGEGGDAMHDLVAKICSDYGLPCRSAQTHRCQEIRDVHMFWDDFQGIDAREQQYSEFLNGLDTDLSELIIHPGKEPEELAKFTHTGDRRIADHAFFSSPGLPLLLSDAGIEVVGWPEVRAASVTR